VIWCAFFIVFCFLPYFLNWNALLVFILLFPLVLRAVLFAIGNASSESVRLECGGRRLHARMIAKPYQQKMTDLGQFRL